MSEGPKLQRPNSSGCWGCSVPSSCSLPSPPEAPGAPCFAPGGPEQLRKLPNMGWGGSGQRKEAEEGREGPCQGCSSDKQHVGPPG